MTEVIYSPCTGQIKDISACSDEAFAAGYMGDGMLVVPQENLVSAPVDGVIEKIFQTNHAFTIKSRSGVEILVHIGVDTIQLNGSPFVRLAQEGSHVTAGTPIIRSDMKAIRRKGLDPSVLVVAMDVDQVSQKTTLSDCRQGGTPLFQVCGE